MTRPDAVRRIKSYSAATGYVYQYYFYEVVPAPGGNGTAYVFAVTADRKNNFAIRVLIRRDALRQWEQYSGRRLTGTEEYAVAKMRLFQGFDDAEDLHASPAGAAVELVVDSVSLASLLQQLDL